MTDHVVSLSPLDLDSVSLWGITMGYVLKSVDIPALEFAAKRMINKWRLLAGRLEWSKELSTWLIRIPLEGDVSHRLKFTSRQLSIPLNTPITTLHNSSAEIIDRPSIEFFADPSHPASLSAYSASNTPFVYIHVTELLNCTCVGISLPHGVFDAFGAGLVVANLNAELNGKSWQAPISPQRNIMLETLKDLVAAPTLYTSEPTSLINYRHQFVPTTVLSMIAFAVKQAFEYFWVKPEAKAAYLSGNVVKELVGGVKEEVRKSNDWVSTADILVAWFLKGAFSQESDEHNSVLVTGTVSTRSLLADKDPEFAHYLHNAFVYSSMSPLSTKALAEMSIADLAILHRQTINSMRNVPYIQAFQRLKHIISIDVIPTSRMGTESCYISNQVSAHLPDIDFGSEMHGFWIWVTPWQVDNGFFVYINEFKGGYLIEARLRRERWEAVAEEVQAFLDTRNTNSCV